MTNSETVPNPGSNEAIARGCICPVLDNAHGIGFMGVAGQFVFAEGCTVHWVQVADLRGRPHSGSEGDRP